MSDETEKKQKKSRRAARRAGQEGEQTGQDSNASTKELSEPKGEATKRAVRKSGASSIRDQGLKAREAAAERRRKKRDRERAQAAAEGLDTSELVDDALARGAHATTRFVQRNFKWMQWVVIAGVAGSFGLLIYNYRVELNNQKGTAQLMAGLDAEMGRVTDEQDLSSEASGFVDTRPEFKSTEARLAAAAEGYQKAIDGDPSDTRKTLARMGLAGVRFDQGKYKEAQKEYLEVKDSALAGKDESLRGRAIEGVGLCLAALNKPDDAAKVFKELENLGENFAPLGQYHRARLLYAKGERDKAKELLQKVLTKSEKSDETFAAPGFVELAAQQLLEAIDPSAAKPQGDTISPEQLKKIQEQLQKAAGLKGPNDPKMEELMKAINSSVGEGAPVQPDEPAPAETSEKTTSDASAPQAPAPKTPPAPAPKPVAPAPPAAPKPVAPAPEPKQPTVPAPAAPAPAAPAPAAPAPASPAAPETP